MEYLKYFGFFLFLAVSPFLNAQQDNVLFYQDTVQVTAEISPYANLTQDQPIVGTLMVTHDSALKVDPATFRIGNDPLKTEFVKEVPLSGRLVITIYQFQLSGKKKGNYNLPPMTVKVGGKEYQAPTLNINVE